MNLSRRRFWAGLLLILFLFAGSLLAQQQIRSLTILHTNDLHAHFLPDAEGRGGFAQIASAIRREKAASEAVLVMNGGDLVQGTPVSTIFDGLPCYEVANAMGYDVNTLGNHEFDYGWQKTLEFIKTARFPTVTSNVVNPQGQLMTGKAYVILNVKDIRVAVIGALTARLAEVTKEDRVRPWRVLPVVETVRRYARQLRPQSDLVVVLSHMFDTEENEVLRNVPEVSVIVSGHNHGGQQHVKDVDGRICVKVRAYGRELGRLDLKIDVPEKRVLSYQWKRIPISSAADPPDPSVAKLVKKWESKVSEVVDVPIGVAKRSLGRDDLRTLIEQAMAESVGADFAYMNRNGIRDGLPQGQILVRQVWNILPFGNFIMYGRLKGKDLPQEAREGRRIDPNREYIVATSDFIADKWSQHGLRLPQKGPLDRDALIQWIKARKVIE